MAYYSSKIVAVATVVVIVILQICSGITAPTAAAIARIMNYYYNTNNVFSSSATQSAVTYSHMYLIVLSSNNIIIVCVVNLPQRRTRTSDCIAKYQVYELTTSARTFPSYWNCRHSCIATQLAIGLVCSYNITIVSNYIQLVKLHLVIHS